MASLDNSTPGDGQHAHDNSALVAQSVERPLQVAPMNGPVGYPHLSQPGGEEGLNYVRLFHSLRRKWALAFGLATAASILVAILLVLLIPAKFQAEALLRVRRSEEHIMRMGRAQVITDRDYKTYKETQAALIRSPYVMNAALRRPAISQLPMIRREQNPVAWLIDNVGVGYLRDSEILKIALKGQDPDEVVSIVDAVKDAYVEEIVVAERASQLTRLDVLKRSYRRNVADIKEKSEVVYKIKEQIGAPDAYTARLRQELEMGNLTEVKKLRSSLQERVSEINTQLEVLYATRGLLNLDPTEFEIEDQLYLDPRYNLVQQNIYELTNAFRQVASSAPAESPTVARLRMDLRSAQAEGARLTDEMKPRIIDRIRRVRGSDESQREEVRQLLSAEKAVAERNRQSTIQQVEEQEQLLKEMEGYSSELASREDELVSLRKITDMMKTEIDSLDLELQKAPRITLMQPANVPDGNDQLIKIAAFGIASTAVFGLVFLGVGFMDYQVEKISVANDVNKDTSVRVIGTLPLLDHRSLKLFGGLDDSSLETVLKASIDSVRTQLLCNPDDKTVDIITVTSATSQEGKSTLAGQLAISLARSGRRTLLVDADVQNPRLHSVFDVPFGQGFCELLRDEANVEDITHALEFEGLWLMPAGYCDATALQALAGDALIKVFTELKSHFDFIIIDAGPVLSGPNAMLLGRNADTTIISVRKDVSRIPKINDACARLRSVGIEIMGAVIHSGGVEFRKSPLQLAEVDPAPTA